jgi:hypothetical protein
MVLSPGRSEKGDFLTGAIAQALLRRTPSGHGSALAGESTSMVSSRLRDFLCRQICQGESVRPQPQLLGPMGWLQILDELRDCDGRDLETQDECGRQRHRASDPRAERSTSTSTQMRTG